MNLNIKNENPIEMLRIKLSMNQSDFANTLKYDSVAKYAYHKNVFSPDILQRVRDVYNVDLISDIIAYLLYRIRSQRPAKQPRRENSTECNNQSPAQLSDLIKRMNGEA